MTVFLIAWVSNFASAMLVYTLVRNSSHRFLDSATGRRLLAPGAIAVVRRDYARLGLAGLLVARFIPGVRAMVPPFAGMLRIPAPRVLAIFLVASGIWYGLVTFVGAAAGSRFDEIEALLRTVGRTTAIGAVVLAAIIAWLWRRRRKKASTDIRDSDT